MATTVGQWQKFESMMEDLQKLQDKCEWLREKVDEQSHEMKRLNRLVANLEKENQDLRRVLQVEGARTSDQDSLRQRPEAAGRRSGHTSRGGPKGPCKTCYGGIYSRNDEEEQALAEMWIDYPLENWSWVCHLRSTPSLKREQNIGEPLRKSCRSVRAASSPMGPRGKASGASCVNALSAVHL